MKKLKYLKKLFISLPIFVVPLMANSCNGGGVGSKAWSNLTPSTQTPNSIINKITNKKITLKFSVITNLNTTSTTTSVAIKNQLKIVNPKLTNNDLSKITVEVATLKRNAAVDVKLKITVGGVAKDVTISVTTGKFISLGKEGFSLKIGATKTIEGINSKLYIGGAGGLYYSTNKGASFTQVKGLPKNAVCNFIYQMPNSKEIITGIIPVMQTSATNLYVSKDGITFTSSKLTGPFIPDEVYDVNNQIVITGLSGAPFYYDTKSSTWKEITITSDPNPFDASFVAFHNGNYYINLDRQLYYASSLTSTSWSKVATFDSVWVYNIKKFGDVYYALTEYGLYTTKNFTTWSHVTSIPGNKTGNKENGVFTLYEIPSSKQILALTAKGAYFSTSTSTTKFNPLKIAPSSAQLISAFEVNNCLFITTNNGLFYSFNFSDLAEAKFSLLGSIGPKGDINALVYAVIDNTIYFGTDSYGAYSTE